MNLQHTTRTFIMASLAYQRKFWYLAVCKLPAGFSLAYFLLTRIIFLTSSAGWWSPLSLDAEKASSTVSPVAVTSFSLAGVSWVILRPPRFYPIIMPSLPCCRCLTGSSSCQKQVLGKYKVITIKNTLASYNRFWILECLSLPAMYASSLFAPFRETIFQLVLINWHLEELVSWI